MTADRIILGRYKVLELVGRGAMGVIYRGLDTVLDREVAIKAMSTDFNAESSPEAKRRFFREARAAAKLQHRNIVTVFEFAEGDDGIPYIVMEFLRGKSLAARLVSGPALSLEEKLKIVAELCDGLQFAATRGIIHRDIKPPNLWLLDDGTLKVVDFGIAKASAATSTVGREIIGSAAYMSPEQAEGHTVDTRSDVFSTGVVLYELLAGRRPFEASTPTATLLKIVHEEPAPLRTIAPGIPAALEIVVDKALEKSPADRYQTAGELASALRMVRDALLAGRDTSLLTNSLLGSTGGKRRGDSKTTARIFQTNVSGTSVTRRWGRLLAAGIIGGLAVAAILYGIDRMGAGPPQDPGRDPSPGTGLSDRLTVRSEPTGATIWVDGTETDLTTPGTIDLQGRRPTVQLVKEGFTSFSAPVTADHIAAGELNVTLKPEPAPLVDVAITGPYPFAVHDRDRRRMLSGMSTRHTIRSQLPIVVRLVAPDYHLNDLISISRVTHFVSKPGQVFFAGREGCAITIEGRRVLNEDGSADQTPFWSRSIASGTRRVERQCGGFSETENVTVIADMKSPRNRR